MRAGHIAPIQPKVACCLVFPFPLLTLIFKFFYTCLARLLLLKTEGTINHHTRLFVEGKDQKKRKKKKNNSVSLPHAGKSPTFFFLPQNSTRLVWKMADSVNSGEKPTEATFKEPIESPPSAPPADVENPSTSTVVVSSILTRWRREDLLKKGNLVLRASAFFFSLISFVVMASNKHGDWRNFNRYEEYRWCFDSTRRVSIGSSENWKWVFEIWSWKCWN